MFLSRYMGDLHLVLPALNVSTLGAGILIMVQQVRLIMFSLYNLNMVDYSMSPVIWVLKWGGLCWDWTKFGDSRLGPGLDNFI